MGIDSGLDSGLISSVGVWFVGVRGEVWSQLRRYLIFEDGVEEEVLEGGVGEVLRKFAVR